MTNLKNAFLFSILAFTLVVTADNPGEDVADNEAEQVVETVEEVEQTESEVEDNSEDTPSESDDGVVTLEKVKASIENKNVFFKFVIIYISPYVTM